MTCQTFYGLVPAHFTAAPWTPTAATLASRLPRASGDANSLAVPSAILLATHLVPVLISLWAPHRSPLSEKLSITI